MNILVINPGSTSTKIAVYKDEKPFLVKTIRHTSEELSVYDRIAEQYDFRKNLILNVLNNEGISLSFDAVIGRGGLLKPIRSGVYEVNEAMKYDLLNATMQHASNLGGLIASELASLMPSCRAFIADPVVVDELDDVSRISGSPLLPRLSVFHALNQKAIGRKYAKSIRSRYEDLNLVIAHLGGGISVAAHKKGRVVDVNNALNGEGPFSPERAGTLPALQLVDLCFSGKYTKDELKKMINGKGGLAAHLGTTDVLTVVKEAESGNKKVALILHAMLYNVAKEIGAKCVALSGKIDAIILTGGIAYNPYCVESLCAQIEFLSPVVVFPGEDEMGALATNALGVLTGDLSCELYA